MNIIQSVLLGLTQGLTEFLPISSSAHLALLPWIFRFNDPGISFDVALHLGTLVAVLFYFRKDIEVLLRGFFLSVYERKIKGYPARKTAWFIIIACIPGALLGYFFEKEIEEKLHLPALIAVFMMAMGALLWAADRLGKKERVIDKMNFLDSLLIGLSQAFALAPGVSRSGITISAALTLGFSREEAARFSFLLSIPIIMGASLLKIRYFVNSVVYSPDRIIFLAGFFSSTIAGFLAIKFMLKFVRSHSYGLFVYYRIIAGLSVLALAFYR